MLVVLEGLKKEIDSVKAIGSMVVGVTCEKPNVLELDEYAEGTAECVSQHQWSASRSRAVESVKEG